MNILGISAFYHESAACVVRDGEVSAAISEERLSRIKHDARFPIHSIRECLKISDLDIMDIDYVAYYEDPHAKYDRQKAAHGDNVIAKNSPHLPGYTIRNALGYEGEICFHPHHLSHAASSYFCSGFEDAAILIADGVGEWATTSYGEAKGTQLNLFEEVRFPHSLGLFYSTITNFLGFRVNNGEYKVMGLAPYGEPSFREKLDSLIDNATNGQFTLNLDYFGFLSGKKMFHKKLSELLAIPPREPETYA